MPQDAPSVRRMTRMGKDFKESDSDSSAMIVLEGQQPLGEDARAYYAGLIKALRDDSTARRTRAGSLGRSAHLVERAESRRQGHLRSAESGWQPGHAAGGRVGGGGPRHRGPVAAARRVCRSMSPVQAPLASDMQHSGNDSILKITLVTVVIIFTMLLLVYRSIVTVILLLLMVGFELAAARGVVAFLGHNDVLVLSTFAVNMLVFLAIAAGTDYGIFFFGRYQEARQAGEDRETAYYTTYRSAAPVWSWRPV